MYVLTYECYAGDAGPALWSRDAIISATVCPGSLSWEHSGGVEVRRLGQRAAFFSDELLLLAIASLSSAIRHAGMAGLCRLEADRPGSRGGRPQNHDVPAKPLTRARAS